MSAQHKPSRDVRESAQVLAMNKTMAARRLGVSVDFFDDHIAGEIKCVRRGRRRLYATRDLLQWLEDNSERVSD